MQISQYIIIKKGEKYVSNSGYFRSRMTTTSPKLEPGEVAVKVVIELPDAIFERPALSAKIVVPEEAVSKPMISADVVNNVQDLIKQNTGFDVRLEVVEKNGSEGGE